MVAYCQVCELVTCGLETGLRFSTSPCVKCEIALTFTCRQNRQFCHISTGH